MDKEQFYCSLFDIVQANVDFKVRFIKTYQTGKDRVPVLMREEQSRDNECFPSVYVGSAYAAYCEGSTVQQIAEKIIDKLCSSVRYIEPTLADGITERNFCDIKDRIFIAETDVRAERDLLHVWHVGDLYFTYLIDISRDKDFTVFVPVLKSMLKLTDLVSEDIFTIACYNMGVSAQVELSIVGGCNCDYSKTGTPLYQALSSLSVLSENPTCIALLEFKPAFLSLSILVIEELLRDIGQYIGRDYCIFQMAEGYCSIALVSREVIERSGELLADTFAAVYRMYNREELQPTQNIFYYSIQDETLYIK